MISRTSPRTIWNGRYPSLVTLGLLLCTEGGEEQIELLQLDKAGIKVAKYMTELPPREVLQRQIQKSLEIAKARLANRIDDEEE